MAPQKLIEASPQQAIDNQPSPPDAGREAELRRSFAAQFGNAVRQIRAVLLRSFLVVFGALTAAMVTGRLLAGLGFQASPSAEAWLQYGGIAVLLWATIGRAGWSIQTMDGETLPERADLAVYRVLYVIGSFCLALPLAW